MNHGSTGCIIYAWSCAEILPKFLWLVSMSGHLPTIILGADLARMLNSGPSSCQSDALTTLTHCLLGVNVIIIIENLILQLIRLICFFIHQLSNMMLSESIPKEPLAFEIIRFDNQKNSFVFLVSYHSPPACIVTLRRMGTSFGHSDCWDRIGRQALVMIGQWYSRRPLTNHRQRLSTQRSQKSLRRKDLF